MTLRDAILNRISQKPGIKSVELVLDMISFMLPAEITHEEIMETLDILAAQQEIVEVEYVLPLASYTIKSIFFPRGTKIRARNSDKS